MSLFWRVWDQWIFLILRVRGGGVDGATLFSVKGDKVMGLNLVLLRSFTTICGGEVGCTGCGCVADKEACTTIKHLRTKVTWPSEPSISSGVAMVLSILNLLSR